VLTGAAALIAAALVVDLGAGPAWRALAAFTGDVLSARGLGAGAPALDVERLATWGRHAAWLALRFGGAPLAAAWAGAVGAGLLQTRGLVRWVAAVPDARRVLGARRPDASALGSALASLVPALGAIAVAAVCLLPWSQALARMGALAPRSLLVVLALGARSIGGALLATVVASAIGQTLWMRTLQRKRLMMTPGEVRRELRELEGEPSLRRERRRRMIAPDRADASAFLSGEVDCVIVGQGRAPDGREDATAGAGAGAGAGEGAGASRWGPLAVALRYRPPGDDAPVVVDRAEGRAAVIMGERALDRGVPCREDVGLARALARLPRGARVPASLFEAVARHLAALDAGPGRRGGGGIGGGEGS
jgi:type III secretion system FlhB-like substrate exporter